VLVYVADPALMNSPLTVQMRDEVYYFHKMVLRSLTSAEVERLLDALFQALGPSTEAWVAVWTKYSSWQDEWRYEILHVKAKNVAQLAEEARRAAGVDFYLGAADARETLSKKYETSKGAAVEAAYLHQLAWRHGDLIVVFFQNDLSARLEVWTANLSAAVEALKKAREAASGM